MNSSSCNAAKVICYVITLAFYLYCFSIFFPLVITLPPTASRVANEKEPQCPVLAIRSTLQVLKPSILLEAFIYI